MMKQFIGLTALVLATCIPLGFAAGTAVRKKVAGSMAVQSSQQTVEKASSSLDEGAQAALREQDKTRYRGTEISPAPDIAGQAFEVQSRISQLFTLLDPPPPPSRLAHFAWVERDNLRINGWYGTIKDVDSDGDRTMVKVQIRPHLASETATVTSTTASYLETYVLTDDGVQFLEGEAPQGELSFLFTD
jgi:hypothetical protein